MGKSGKRDTGSGQRPVKNIQISEKNRTVRLILLVVCLAVAVVAFWVGIRAILTTESGWTTVDSTSAHLNCSGDFVFSYCYGQTEEPAAQEKKRLTMAYTQASEDAWRIFYEDIADINAAVNTPITVDPALYKALSQIVDYESRYLFLGPVYTEYNRIFNAEGDAEAAALDPANDAELASYLAELTSFANDPRQISLDMMDNSQVCLRVSEAYRIYALENEITEFLDFGWMVNAFVVDYLADTLMNQGFSNGFLSSYDGFTRNLDNRGEEFNLNLFNRRGTNIYLPGIMQYNQPIAIVSLRDYPLSQLDRYHYYAFENGRTVTTMLDPADGMCKSATDSLVGYSYEGGCVDVLLLIAPVFIADSLDKAVLSDLRNNGISALWVEDTVLYCNDRDLSVKLNKEAGIDYTLQYTN